jgi:MFS family permease
MLPAPVALLREVDFRHVWLAGACGNTVRWLEILAISVYTFELTGSPFLVALMTVLRALPILLLGSITGAIAERVNRRLLLAGGLGLAAAISGVLAALAWFGLIQLWHIGLGAFLNGIVWTTEHPVRRTMIHDAAGRERLGVAMGVDTATQNVTRMLGPLSGGVLYQAIGLEGAYLASLLLMAAGAALASRLRLSDGARSPAGDSLFLTMVAGVRYVSREPAILAVLAVTMIVNLFGFPYATMIAVIGREVLALSATEIGLLMSAEAAGAFVGSLLIASYARPQHYQRLFFLGGTFFVCTVIVFSHLPSFVLSLAVLTAGGLGVAGFASMQTTVILSLAPPGMRSRAMGALAVAIGFGPLGMFHVGLLASWLGAPAAVLTSSLEGLAGLAICALVWPELRRRHRAAAAAS